MSETLIARRYAEGLSAVLTGDRDLDPALTALRDFVEVYDACADLRGVIENPAIDVAVRSRLLDAVLERMAMPEAAASFVRALFVRHRIRAIRKAVAAFSHLCDVRLNRESAEITTAVPLTDEQAAKLVHAVEVFASKSIEATRRVDPSIIGGVVVRVGGFVVDRSVRRELTRIKRDLLRQE